jgi:hypothetical protein
MGGIEPPLQPSSLRYPLLSKCDPAKLTSAKKFMPKINQLESKSPNNNNNNNNKFLNKLKKFMISQFPPKFVHHFC